MTGEEQRKIAFGYMNGTDGLPKDEAKGWDAMKQAAEQGDAQACFEYAAHIVKTDHTAALRYCAKGNIKSYLDGGGVNKSYADTYVEALAKNAAQNPTTAAFGLNKALEIKDYIKGDGWYWLAEITKRANPDDRGAIMKYLANSNIYANMYGGSEVPQSTFAEYGMERGLLRNGDEFDRWRARLSDTKATLHIVALKKGEGMARALAGAALDDDRSKNLGSARVAKMKGMTPTAVLEYQKVYGQNQFIGTYSYGFRHQASNSVTYTTGSGTCEINTWYVNYSSLFKNRIKNDDLNDWINDMEYADDIEPTARVRVNVPREREVRYGIIDRHLSAYDLIKARVAKTYNWYASDITLNGVKELSEYVPWEDDYTFIPFWFLNYRLDGENVTARVNGYTGEVDFFINNPFGQFTDKDDVLVNGGAVQSAGGATKSGPRKRFSIGAFIALSLLFPVVGGILYILGYLKSK